LDAFITVLEPLIPLIEAIVPPLVEVLKAITPIIIPLAKLIGLFIELGSSIAAQNLVPILKLLVPIFDAIAVAVGFVTDRISELVEWIGKLAKWLSKIAFGENSLFDVANKAIGGLRNKSTTTTTVGDAIIRPNGQIIKTDPRDTLIATKSGFGGVTIVIQGDMIGLDSEDISRRLSDELNSKVSL